MLHPQNFVKWIPIHLRNTLNPVLRISRTTGICTILGAAITSSSALHTPNSTEQIHTRGSAHRKITSIHPSPSPSPSITSRQVTGQIGTEKDRVHLSGQTWSMMIHGVNPIQKTRPWKRTRAFWSVVKIDLYYIYMIYYIKLGWITATKKIKAYY